MLRLINILFVLDYLHAKKNTDMRIKDQLCSFSVSVCQKESWPVLKIMFAVYQRDSSWNFILSDNNQVDKLIFNFYILYISNKKNTGVRIKGQLSSFSVSLIQKES